MKQISKIIFWTAITFLGFWIILPLIRMVFDLEFATDDIKSSYKQFLFYAVPIAILLTLSGTLKPQEKSIKRLSKIFGTIVAGFAVMFIMFISVFTDMCVWTNKQVLYQHKHKPNTKIIVRDFGCGATDSSPPTIAVYQVQYFTNYFIRTTKIDTTTIDKSNWVKVE